MLIVRSPVRVSFGGGGTDLPAYYQRYGGAVLSTAINKYFYCILQKREDDMVQVISSDLRVFDSWRQIADLKARGSELEIPLAVLQDFGQDIAVNLFLASEIPPGTGLGSSATVCVNLLKTLATYLQLPLSKYQLAERAFNIARNVLGKPVGKQDEYAAAFGGLNLLTFARDGTASVEPLELDPELLDPLQARLMLFFTGSAHNSWEILKAQEHATDEAGGVAVESLHLIHDLALQMRAALQNGDLRRFGALLDQSWQAKKRVTSRISSDRIDHLYALARENGALGGKITGAGGGGFLLLYCPEEHQDNVRSALHAGGVREMAFEFDLHGAQVLVNDPFLDGDERAGSRWTFHRFDSTARGSGRRGMRIISRNPQESM
jgi:D-glycero-alpha-D-manno-heptose-7-phosphate kinase